jgi:hypothetical protein
MNKKNNRWLMPTSADNLKMIVAQGLISAPNGFGKYYKDPLELYPGHIPLFKNIIPADILKIAISETDGLIPCIIEFDLGKIEGKVKVIKGNNINEIDILKRDIEEFEFMLIPAPLPLLTILKVIFESNAQKTEFIKDARTLYSNVPLTDFKIEAPKKDNSLFNPVIKGRNILFESSNIETVMSANCNENIKAVVIDYNLVYTFGGMLLNLFYFAKNGELSNKTFHNVCSSEAFQCEKDYSIIANYFVNGKSEDETSNPREKMLKKIIDLIIKNKNFKDSIIFFLEGENIDSKTKKRSMAIAATLREFDSILKKPAIEYFSDAKSTLEKMLLILFLREDSEALIDYQSVNFCEEEYLSFAMLFGIRDKFIKSPKFLREFSGLQNFISLKMAEYAHTKIGSNLTFHVLQKPITLFDMLKNNNFKIWFSNQYKMDDCFETKISVPIDKCRFKNERDGMQIIMDGIVRAPVSVIKEDKYYQAISKIKITDYNKILNKYKNLR